MFKQMLFGTVMLGGVVLGNPTSIATPPTDNTYRARLHDSAFEIAAAPKVLLIVPGVSVGSVKIGSKPKANPFPELGKPQISRSPDSPSSYSWKCSDYVCSVIVKTSGVGANEVVSTIYITEKKLFKTQAGIGIGSTIQQVKKAYPSGKQIDGMDADFCWSISGANFCVNQGIVSSIAIFNPLIGET